MENAIRHGIEPYAMKGIIELRSRREGDRLVVTVSDNGPGWPEGGTGREGVGLSNTRARLEQLYGGNHRFEFDPAPGGGLRITLDLPCVSHGPGAAPWV